MIDVKSWVLFSIIASLLVAVAMMQTAIKHNPQGEFSARIVEESVERVLLWGDLTRLGLLWFLLSFVVLSACGSLVLAFRRFLAWLAANQSS